MSSTPPSSVQMSWIETNWLCSARFPHSGPALVFPSNSSWALTLMSGPPGDISSRRQVQRRSPAAAIHLLISRCHKPKPHWHRHTTPACCDNRCQISVWYLNHAALNVLCRARLRQVEPVRWPVWQIEEIKVPWYTANYGTDWTFM